jgi:hypothetical protein
MQSERQDDKHQRLTFANETVSRRSNATGLVDDNTGDMVQGGSFTDSSTGDMVGPTQRQRYGSGSWSNSYS